MEGERGKEWGNISKRREMVYQESSGAASPRLPHLPMSSGWSRRMGKSALALIFFLAYQALHGTSRADASTSGRAAAAAAAVAATGRGATIFFFARRCRGGGFQFPSPDEVPEKERKSHFFGFQFSV